MEQKEHKKLPVISKIFRGWTLLLLCAAVAVTGLTAALVRFDKVNHDDLVIVLDPGHGGADVGATNTALGLYESEINLKIALACRDQLEQYDGVRVYMTHTGVRSEVAKSTLSSRVSVAGEVGADIFISLHINSAESKDAAGAEIYVPMTTHEPKYNEECTKLAERILANFQALGLGSRGVKTRASGGGRVYTFADGTTEPGDYYYVIGEPISRLGIPGMLVEHAFIDGDAAFLDTDAKLAALGQADARAIADHYGLTLNPQYADGASPTVNTSSPPTQSTATTQSTTAATESTSRTASTTSTTSTQKTQKTQTTTRATQSTVSSEPLTDEEEKDPAVVKVESLIKALPDNPTESDSNKIHRARKAFLALDEPQKNTVDAQLYQKLCNVVTAYENLTHPIRFTVKEGSEMSIDRVNGKLLHAETAMQQSHKITVFSLAMELELFIDPEVPDEYKQDGVLTFRAVSPDGKPLDYDDEVTDGSVISVLYNDLLLDSLDVSIQP